MKNLQKTFKIFVFTMGLLTLPILVAAQVAPGTGPVPVPYVPAFGGCGIIGSLLGACSPAGSSTATQLLISLIQIGLAIAGLVAVLFVIVGGFRYITAHGNEEQAEGAKKTMTQAIIGIVIIILSFVIIRVIVSSLILGGAGT